MKLTPVISIERSHVDENGVTVIEEATLQYIAITREVEHVGQVTIRGVEPIDKDIPLPALDDKIEVSGTAMNYAIDTFNTALPKWDGLLNAEVVD